MKDNDKRSFASVPTVCAGLAVIVVCVYAALPGSEASPRFDRAPARQASEVKYPGEIFGKYPDCELENDFGFSPVQNVLPNKKAFLQQYLTALLNVPAYKDHNVTQLQGLEVGALVSPAPVPAFVNMTYVDYADEETLDKVYRLNENFRKPDIISSAEKLEAVPSSAYNVYMAFHVIEHTRDPVSAFVNGLRVLRRGGLFIFALPSMCGTFDKDRVLTSVEHMMSEHSDPARADANDREHHKEWTLSNHRANVLDRDPKAVLDRDALDYEARAETTLASQYPVHYHTFLPGQVQELLAAVNKLTPEPTFKTIFHAHNVRQVYFVLQKLVD